MHIEGEGDNLAAGLINTPRRVIVNATGPGTRAGGAVHWSKVEEITTAGTDTMVEIPPNEEGKEGVDEDEDDWEEPPLESPTVPPLPPPFAPLPIPPSPVLAVGPNTQARLASFIGYPDPTTVTRVPPRTVPAEG